MRRRQFLQLCLAGAVGSRLAFAFSSDTEFCLKLGNSDTPIFPFRTGEHAWWGYVDAAGQVLISADNSRIIARFGDFYGGLGAVRYDDGSAWMIDMKGSKRFPIYPGSSGWNYVLREGLMPNRDSNSAQWGYVDSAGRWVIAPSFAFAFPFSQERAVVAVGQRKGVIDPKGKWVIPASFSRAFAYSDGFLCVQQGKRFAFLDRNGRPAFGRDFEQASGFQNGLAAVRDANRMGVIDTSGRVVMPFQYEAIWLGNDPNSPMLLKRNGAWEISNNGRRIPLPPLRIEEPFSCGRAIVHDDLGGTCHFIGSDGTQLFGMSYWRPEPFVLDRAVVQMGQGGEHAWINQRGEPIFRWRASNLTALEEQMRMAQ